VQRLRHLRRVLSGFGNLAKRECPKGESDVSYDAVIVGAGIAGLSTGMNLAKAGWKVCIIDRRHEIGVPVRCGEATGNRTELARFVEIDEAWIACDIKGLTLHVNDSLVHEQPVDDCGVILHRDRFEKYLAQKAVSFGATLLLDTVVSGLHATAGGAWGGVTLESGETVNGSYIVGADGAESYVGRWAGLMQPLALNEIASAVQYRIKTGFCNDGFLHFFIGAKFIPYGYIWVFPKSNGMTLVGCGMYRCSPAVPKPILFVNRFIEERIKPAEPYRDTLITGGVPVVISPRKLTKENIVLVGDSARQVNPLTAGGIMNALEDAETAARHLIKGSPPGRRPRRDGYSRGWARNQRFQHKLFTLLRELWFSTPDAKLIPRLTFVFSLMKKMPDRSKPFRLPIVPITRFLLRMLPPAIRHLPILFK
jgi:digeranylgeranylglycerophospholipid reductase